MPQLMTVRYAGPDGRRRRLFIPILPVLLLLSPLLVLALLGGLIACRIHRVDPVGAIRGAGQLLWSASGTRLDIEDGRTVVQVSLR